MNYQQTPARRYLMGAERTTNPSAATTYLLGPQVARRAARRQAYYRTRPAHRGNPLPAVASILGSGAAKKVLGAIGIKTGSPRVNGGPLVSTVEDKLQRARAGELAAVRELHRLATSPAEPHRVQWAKVWNTLLPALEGALPAEVQREIGKLDPTSVFAARAKELSAAAAGRAERAAAAAEAKQARREAQLASIAGTGLQALARGGRRPGTRRRSRRRSGRRVSL